MKQYIIRRLLLFIPIIFGISFILFFLYVSSPGDPLSGIISTQPGITPERIQELRTLYGLDGSIIQRYFNWLKNAIRFDFGVSLNYREPVSSILGVYIWNSFYLNVLSFLFSVFVSIPLGIYISTKHGKALDKFVLTFSLLFTSLPTFVLGIIAIKYVAPVFGLPIIGMTSIGSNYTGIAYVKDVLLHTALPFIILSLFSLAGTLRVVKTSMLEVIRQDYIRTARAKGVSEKVVIYKHAFRNALIPLIPIIVGGIVTLFSGSIIIEQVFGWPGIGNITYQAILNRDYPLLMGSAMFYAILTIFLNLLTDIVYAFVDPRIRLK